MYIHIPLSLMYIHVLLFYVGIDNNITCHGCLDPSGIAFKLVYDASTGLFSTLLAAPQKHKKGTSLPSSCPLHSFMFLNNEHELEAVNIMTSCHKINLGLFPILKLKTQIYIFNECKIGSLCTILNSADANIIVWSTFPDHLSEASLGNFLKVLPLSNKTGLIATFSKDYKHFNAKLPRFKILLFNKTFESVAIVDEQQLTFSKSVKLYNKYFAKLNGKIGQVAKWRKAVIQIHGTFTNGNRNIPRLICNQIVKYIDILYNRSQVEINNAKTVYNRALSRYTKANITYNQRKIAMNKSSNQVRQTEDIYKKVKSTLTSITKQLQIADDKVKKLLKDIDNLCTIKQCPEVCVPRQVCEDCKRDVSIPIQGTCIFTCNKPKNITVVISSKRATRWAYVPKLNCSMYPSCHVISCINMTRCVTSYISRPVTYVVYKTGTILVNTITRCDKPCSETVAAAPTMTLCCANFTCNSTVEDIGCLRRNQECAQRRKKIYLSLDDAEKRGVEILQSLDEAKKNETIIKLRLLRLKTNYTHIEFKFNESKQAYNETASMLEIAAASFETIKHKSHLAKLEKAKSSSICGFAPSSFLQIESVSFDANIVKESPTLLAVNVEIYVASRNVTVTETIHVDFNKVTASLKQGALIIIEKLVLSQSTPSKRQSRSAVNESIANSNELYFQRKCADVKNILNYIKGLNASIFTIATSATYIISFQFE